MSKPSIVIIGPPGCGKTRHAQALRNYYGMDRVIDDIAPDSNYKVPARGALVLAIVPLPTPPGVRIIQFKDAARAACLPLKDDKA